MYYFDEVRKLKHLTSEIPGHIDDHEVVIGVSALFEKNIEEAEKHFEAAVREGETRNKPTHTGRIGLCLCRWQSGEILEVDEELSTILKEMEPDEDHSEQSPVETECPHCGKDYRVKRRYLGQHVKCKSCRRRFEVLEGQSEKQDQESPEDQDETVTLSDDEQILSDSDLLLRNVRLWHSMVCVARWQSLPELSGLPDDQRESLQKRLDGVKQIDPSIGDPYLISGLIQYYFAKTDEERTAGKEQIESSIDKDVHLPEVLQLIDRENKLASLSEHSLSYFHQLARKYVENAEVDVQLRERFARKMNRFQRFRTLGEVSGESEEAAVPSLENLKGRGQILSTRVSNILQYRQDETSDELKEQIGERLDNMQQQTQSLSETAQALQKTEFELMEHTGEFLFQDENPAGDQVD